jgi:phosphatase NudJ
MAREPISTWFFVVVVVRLGHRFLVVHEGPKHGQLWYLPAGRVEIGESFVEAAKRETLEEAGIPIEVESIIRFEHSAYSNGTARLRVLMVARPIDDTPPKSKPDSESLEASWLTLDQLKLIPLRGPEVIELCQYLAEGGAVYPVQSLLTPEGFPLRFKSAGI